MGSLFREPTHPPPLTCYRRCGADPLVMLMLPPRIPCLVLACGNTLRGDDGVGPDLAAWAQERFEENPGVRVLSRHLWTADLAEEIAHAKTVLFLDASAEAAPGSVQLTSVEPETSTGIFTHHVRHSQLLGLCQELYACLPSDARLLTVGMASTELGAAFSEAVQQALPRACALLEETVQDLLGNTHRS